MDLFVIFFLPSSTKVGCYPTFLGIIIAMGVLGLVLLILGYKVRGKSSAE